LYLLKEYPLKSDVVEKWSDVEGLWNYVLSSLMSIQDNPDFPVLISQPALSPKKHTEKIAEVSSSCVVPGLEKIFQFLAAKSKNKNFLYRG
jgi:actin-related protein